MSQLLMKAIFDGSSRRKVERILNLLEPHEIWDTAMHEVAYQDRPDIMRLILNKKGTGCLNLKTRFGNTPLHEACFGDSTRAIEFLLSFPEVDASPVNDAGYTPLAVLFNEEVDVDRSFSAAALMRHGAKHPLPSAVRITRMTTLEDDGMETTVYHDETTTVVDENPTRNTVRRISFSTTLATGRYLKRGASILRTVPDDLIRKMVKTMF